MPAAITTLRSTIAAALANNSVAYTDKPDMEGFMREWLSLVESKSGERGIFSRVAADNHVKMNGRREIGHEWGTNPCSEIILRPYQFCNLTEVVFLDRGYKSIIEFLEHAQPQEVEASFWTLIEVKVDYEVTEGCLN